MWFEARIKDALEAWHDLTTSLPRDLLIAEGYNPNGTEDEKSRYRDVFFSRVRRFYKEDKGSNDPYRFDASKKTITKTSVADAKELDENSWVAYGNLKILQRLYDETLPKRDEKTGVQQHYIPQDVPIFDKEGKFIFIKDRKEIHAFEDPEKQTRFIDAKFRSSIVDGEWDSIRLSIGTSFFKDDKGIWTIGPSIELQSIHKVFDTDYKPRSRPLYDETNPDLTRIPKALPIPSGDDPYEQPGEPGLPVTMTSDAALLNFDLEKAVHDHIVPPALEKVNPDAPSETEEGLIKATQNQQTTTNVEKID